MGVGSGATTDESTHIQCAERSSVCGRTIHSSQQVARERFESPEVSVDSIINRTSLYEGIRKVSEWYEDAWVGTHCNLKLHAS